VAEIPAKPVDAKKAVLYGTLTATAIAILGGVLTAAGDEVAGYGLTMFLAVPVASGFVAACFARPLWSALLAILLALGLCFLGLLFTGLEGLVCILMAAPLFVVGGLVGAGLGWLARQKVDSRANLLLFPFLALGWVFVCGQAEMRLRPPERTETVVSTCTISTPPEKLWAEILTVDDLSADKPLLLRLGLPVPRSCTLDGSGVGAKRVCYFDTGVIEEEVSAWDPPHYLGLKLVRVTLPGRHWLRFHSASYSLEAVGPGQTAITRSTTISSKLRPGWYWSHLERLGLEAEHRYLFDALAAKEGD
jgi:hypothetical protein